MKRLLVPVAAVLGLFFAYPLLLVIDAASVDAWRWLAGDYARSRVAIALQQGFLSLFLTLAVAFPIALLHHRQKIRGSRVLLALHVAPFVLPVFVVAGGLRELLGAGGWVERLGGHDVLTWIGPLGTVVLANAYYNTGLAARLIHTALERRARLLEESAAVLGANPKQVALRITFPLLLPAFVGTALLVLLLCLGSFGIVLLLGGEEVDTLDTLIYANLRGAFPREDRGAILVIAQIALQATLLAGVLWFDRRAARFAGDGPTPRPEAGPVSTSVAWMLASIALLPALAVLIGGFQLRGEWSLAPWQTLLDENALGHLTGFNFVTALGWTIFYAAAAVACSLALTACLAYAGKRGRLRPLIEGVAALPLGTSSVVLGFGFLLAFTGRTWIPLFGSPIAIVAAHTLIAFPFTARVLIPALHGLEGRLDDAAQLLGASRRGIAWRIHLPLLRRPLAAAAAFAAVLSIGDYGASLLLMTDDLMSLAVWTGRHGGPGAFDPLARAQSTALAGFLMLLTLAAFMAFERAAPDQRAK